MVLRVATSVEDARFVKGWKKSGGAEAVHRLRAAIFEEMRFEALIRVAESASIEVVERRMIPVNR